MQIPRTLTLYIARQFATWFASVFGTMVSVTFQCEVRIRFGLTVLLEIGCQTHQRLLLARKQATGWILCAGLSCGEVDTVQRQTRLERPVNRRRRRILNADLGRSLRI